MALNEGPGSNCEIYYSQEISGLKAVEKQIILDIHNERRNQVALGKGVYQTNIHQPSASNMRQMSWDDELETFAQRWADQCVKFDAKEPHDKCRTSVRFNTGQNIASAGIHKKKKGKLILPVPNTSGLTMEWFKEIHYYNPEWVDGYRRHPSRTIKIGHYSQFVWGETYLIGCGHAVYKETIRKKEYIFEKLVCNYGPSGNYLGSPLYSQGVPCSNCPKGTRCNMKYGGLCANVLQFSKNVLVTNNCPVVVNRNCILHGKQIPLATVVANGWFSKLL